MNNVVIKWARETAGLTVEDAAHQLGLSSPQKLTDIESGATAPSRPQLLKMSKVYHRSLLTFYLEAPPAKSNRGEDFRTLSGEEHSAKDDALLDVLVRGLKARQEMVKSVLESEEEQDALWFVGKFTKEHSITAVRESIAATLDISIEEYRKKRTPEASFSYLREKAEAAGIFVLLAGNLGSHHTNIPVSLFRGFAIADPVAPFVLINDQDTNTAWSFTLLHELAHIWLGETGVSGTASEKSIEKFCNEVASTFLLPRNELNELPLTDAHSAQEAIELIIAFSKRRLISLKMVAYVAYMNGLISSTKWQEINYSITQLLRTDKERLRQSRHKDDSGPSYYVVRRHRIGNALINLVERTLSSGALTPVKAAKVLGVKPRGVSTLLHRQGYAESARSYS